MDIKQLHTSTDKQLIAFAESRIGGRSENQDSFHHAYTPHGFLVTVCDGMGGGPSGRTASTIAVKEIVDAISEAPDEEATANIVIKAVRRANMAIIDAATENPKLRGMGSTATVLLVGERSAFIAHVGDSRVYQLRGHRKVFRTFDHSMVFELVSQGVITEEQARLSAQSNIITRALGIQPDVEVDVKEVPYLKGDRFLLCTDGIHGALPEAELIQLATSRKSVLGALVDDIATRIDNAGRLAGGGHDNLTLAIVETLANSKLKPAMSKETRLTMLALAIVAVLSITINILLLTGVVGTDKQAAPTDTTATATPTTTGDKVAATQTADKPATNGPATNGPAADKPATDKPAAATDASSSSH